MSGERDSARRDLTMIGLRQRSRPRHGTCRSCGASILWVDTTRGKPMPCDPRRAKIVLDTGEVAEGWASHASCPHAAEHKRQPEAQRPLDLRAPERRWPAGTDPWAIVHDELAPAYEQDPELRVLLEVAGEDDPRGVMVDLEAATTTDAAGATVHVSAESQIARLARLRTYRVLGVRAIEIVREQSAPRRAWVRRNPRLLAAVRERIET